MDIIRGILKDLHPEYDFDESDDFVEDGLLDSFDIVSLVTALEETFGILIDGLDIVPTNFRSVEAVAAVVRKNGGSI